MRKNNYMSKEFKHCILSLENLQSASTPGEIVQKSSDGLMADASEMSHHSLSIPGPNRNAEQSEILLHRYSTNSNEIRLTIPQENSNSMAVTSWLDARLPRQEVSAVQTPQPSVNAPIDPFVINVEEEPTPVYSLSQDSHHGPYIYQNHNHLHRTATADNLLNNIQGVSASTNRNNSSIVSNRPVGDNVSDEGRNINEDNNAGGEQAVTALPIRPEVHQILKVIQNHLTFVGLLIGKAVYDHRSGTLCLVLLLIVFMKANNDLKREIAKQQDRSRKSLFRILCYIFGVLAIISLILNDYPIFFMYSPKKSLSFWDLLWSVIVTDFVVKLLTVALKIVITCLPANLLAFQKRGKYYLGMEAASQFYRSTIPMYSWMSYFKEAYQGPEVILGIIMASLYGATKIRDLLCRGKLLVNAVIKFWQNISLGCSPLKEQLVASGGTCVICYEEYSNPVQLHCNHIFCESCVSIWLDRERTCPLCRSPITDDPVYRDGHTAQFIQFY